MCAMAKQGTRREILERLVTFAAGIEELTGLLSGIPWDADEALVTLSRVEIASVLTRYIEGEISERDLVEWANLLEMREDIGYQTSFEEMISNFVFEAANPELEGRASVLWARSWLQRLDIGSESR
jgi:hypothetical protein